MFYGGDFAKVFEDKTLDLNVPEYINFSMPMMRECVFKSLYALKGKYFCIKINIL